MNATLAPASPWYCAVLRRASAWLARLAQELEVPALDGAALPPREALDFLCRCDTAEERLRETRMRYY